MKKSTYIYTMTFILANASRPSIIIGDPGEYILELSEMLTVDSYHKLRLIDSLSPF